MYALKSARDRLAHNDGNNGPIEIEHSGADQAVLHISWEERHLVVCPAIIRVGSTDIGSVLNKIQPSVDEGHPGQITPVGFFWGGTESASR